MATISVSEATERLSEVIDTSRSEAVILERTEEVLANEGFALAPRARRRPGEGSTMRRGGAGGLAARLMCAGSDRSSAIRRKRCPRT
jgi:hypothetical protein